MFDGDNIQMTRLDGGYVELCFNAKHDAINKLDTQTVTEFRQVTQILTSVSGIKGAIITSAKDVFIVGADIKGFDRIFQQTSEEIASDVLKKNDIFVAFDDLPFPTVVAINGFALGGGLELALSATYRVMSSAAQVGLPEVKLGLFPGFGGTVRMCRLAGPAVAADWVVSGKPAKGPAALDAGVVDELCEPEVLRRRALAILEETVAGQRDWRAVQQRKQAPVALPEDELKTIFDAALEKTQALAAAHQPAASMAVAMMARASRVDREQALALEAEAFGRVAKTQAASSLVQLFLNDQIVKKRGRQFKGQARAVKQIGVLGAGIMGGGIAYVNALRGTPVVLKDISNPQIDLGLTEASKLLAKQVKTGRLTQADADRVLASIKPKLNDEGLDKVDMVIEAIIERLEIKQQVLKVLEAVVRDDAVIASNTSSLRIDDIASGLARPENLVGMHFFNPVPAMPLVEIVQGSRSSEAAVATAVTQAQAMGKTPIVVKDCPGFLVNRLITPYVAGFLQLIADGADFEQVDQVMEAFGWPMGPAYLQDVVGMDTSVHVADVIAAGYPQRMKPVERNAVRLLVENKRFGQKSGSGFYQYVAGEGGRLKKQHAPEAHALLSAVQPSGRRSFEHDEVVDRMMLPLIIEAAHALEEGVVETPAELDTAMLLGLGFPAYLGGPLKYADWLGLQGVVARCDRYASLGPAYQATPRMREMAQGGLRYHGR